MQGRTLFMRSSGVCAIAAVSAVVLSSLGPAGRTVPVVRAADVTPACASVNPATETGLMRAYRNAGSYRARQTNTARGTSARVAVTIPPIAFTAPGQSSTLPVGPCQTIYRFAFSQIRASRHATASPFKYVEVDDAGTVSHGVLCVSPAAHVPASLMADPVYDHLPPSYPGLHGGVQRHQNALTAVAIVRPACSSFSPEKGSSDAARSRYKARRIQQQLIRCKSRRCL
jgi:hypothetical protein